MVLDEDLARQFLRSSGQAPKARRRMSEWSPETELLSTVVDRLAELIQTVAASHGAKPKQITPAPRPETAGERVRHMERVRKHRSIVARVLPHKADPDHRSSAGGDRPSR